MSCKSLTLEDLRHLLRKDPDSYRDEFNKHYASYIYLEQSFLDAPSQFIESLEELVIFISGIIHSFPSFKDQFVNNVSQALISRSFGMHPAMRLAYSKAFMRLKSKNIINPLCSIDVAFKLFRCHDKHVRKAFRIFLIGDIKRMNMKQRCPKVNSNIQTFLTKMLKDNNPTISREAVLILTNLFRKNVWRDAKTANIIAEACLIKPKKVYGAAVRFFLGQDKNSKEKDSDSESELEADQETCLRRLKLRHRVGVKSRKRLKQMERSIENVKRKADRKAKSRRDLENRLNLPAINMVNDAQTFADRLFRKLEHCNDRFEVRMFLVELISQLIGIHKVMVPNFYPFIQRFLRPHQREVTRLLLFAAQASHDQIPPDMIESVVRSIADNFITDRASAEAISVGLNAVREICARCPYAVGKDMLSDLIGYRSYTNKNVVAAARSLIRLYRQINPALLPPRERGRPTEALIEAMSTVGLSSTTFTTGGPALEFGRPTAVTGIPGSECLIRVSAPNLIAYNDSASKSQLDATEKSSRRRRLSLDEFEAPDIKRARLEASSGVGKVTDVTNDDIEFSEECSNSDSSHLAVDNSGKPVDNQLNEDSSGKRKLLTFLPSADIMKLALEEASSRIFTQDEFEAMHKYQVAKQKRFASLLSARHRRLALNKVEDEEPFGVDNEEPQEGENASDDEMEKDNADENEAGSRSIRPGRKKVCESQQLTHPDLLPMSAITRLVKRPKQSKAERLESVQTGREGRSKFGFQVNRMNPHASTTNREKRKRKTFQMIKHKVKGKAFKRSFREKQIALREHLKKVAKMKR